MFADVADRISSVGWISWVGWERVSHHPLSARLIISKDMSWMEGRGFRMDPVGKGLLPPYPPICGLPGLEGRRLTRTEKDLPEVQSSPFWQTRYLLKRDWQKTA